MNRQDKEIRWRLLVTVPYTTLCAACHWQQTVA